jgi:sugar transferase EpsL
MSAPQTSANRIHVVVIDPWQPGPVGFGPDRTGSLIRNLTQAGHKVTRLAPATFPRRFGFPAVAAPGAGYGVSLFFSLLRQPSVDLIVLRGPPTQGSFVASLFALISGAPLVIDAPEIGPTQRSGLITGMIKRFLRAKAAYVSATSPEIKTWFEAQGFEADDVGVHPDGADTNLFTPKHEMPASLVEKIPALARGPVCIYAGSLHRGRNVAGVLETAAAMLSIAPEVRFLIVGDGPDRLDLNAYAARLDVLENNIWFLPAVRRAELPAILSAASVVLALPSRIHDGALDAAGHIYDGLAAGKPVAVLGEGWQRDLIDTRQAGVALPPNDAAAAARELADFLKDGELVRRAGEQALALASGKHNAERALADFRHALENVATTQSRLAVLRRRSLAMKRLTDVVVSSAGLIVFSPLIVLISLACLFAGWQPFAGRMRSGARGKPYRLFTFDTTKAEHDAGRAGLARFLRRSALDRLPELLNVLIGDMSLVGPRPLPAEYTAYYTEAQLRRLEMRPGITGWAQVNGKQGLTWDDMFTHDRWYIDHYSLGLDAKILGKTLIGLFLGRGFGNIPAGQLPRFDEIEARRQGAEDA